MAALRWYKNKYHYRALFIGIFAFALWFFLSHRNLSDGLFSLAISVGFDYMTINLIFKREFYPLDLFAEAWFRRDSRGYRALYITYYVVFWLMILYAMIAEWS